MRMITDEQLHETLRQRFGHPAFRPGQEEIIRSVLDGRPTLAVMPTGAGKSLCYQLPALLLPGVTLVVSPLLALMQDQVEQLHRRGVEAVFVNSAQAESERASTEREIASGRHRLVFVAPERFRSASFLRALAAVKIDLLAVDEAHCVSEWGHSFRPDYEKLGEVLDTLHPPRIVALTATASPDVRADIVRALRMRNPEVRVAGFDRPNIHIEVHRLSTEAEKRDSLLVAVRTATPAIVYTATRRQAADLARHLVQNGVRARPYHAGLEADERRSTQESFSNGTIDVVTATNAFGLGVDKSDVRIVVHTEIPRSLEAYYQEIGRAGRDGAPAIGALFFAGKDIFLQKHLLELSNPSPHAVTLLFERARLARRPLSREELSASLPGGLGRNEPLAALGFLEGLGLLERRQAPGPLKLQLLGKVSAAGESAKSALARLLGTRRGELAEEDAARALGAKDRRELNALLADLEAQGELKRLPTTGRSVYGLAKDAVLSDEHLRRLRVRTMREHSRLQQMIGLAQQTSCRRRALLKALGDASDRRTCDACDVCAGHRLSPVRSRLAAAREGSRAAADAWTVSDPLGKVPGLARARRAATPDNENSVAERLNGAKEQSWQE